MRGPTGSIRARCDETDRLVHADEPLASLQLRSGGQLPGLIAIPSLLGMVRTARRHGVPLSRTLRMLDETTEILAWAKVEPVGRECRIELSQWRPGALAQAFEESESDPNIIRHLAEGYAWLDGNQRILAADLQTPDLASLQEAFSAGRGRPWTDFVEIAGNGHRQPLHWRLLDKSIIRIEGSERSWRAHILPRPGLPGTGFELCLVPEDIAEVPALAAVAKGPTDDYGQLLGRELAPTLKLPIQRIITNADTIRTRMAGPLAEQYSNYASDIANAGRHLLNLIEDLADLETVESPDFLPAAELLDLADLSRQAGAMLSGRAADKDIALLMPSGGAKTPAVGEMRRVLQILLNLLSNAIHYSPQGTTVTVTTGTDNGTAWAAVSDEGQGLNSEQAARVFEKFERLGRKGDGGSGLGLYISRKLARAMGGELRVESEPGNGARFILNLRDLRS